MPRIFYFAYGSNLLPQRIEARLGRCPLVTVAEINGRQLRINKTGLDGSAKCNAFRSGNDGHTLQGVIYRLTSPQKYLLDKYEGLGRGYHIEWEDARCRQSGKKHPVMLYVADRQGIREDIRPFRWYRDYVLDGARYFSLSAETIRALEAHPVIDDDDNHRNHQNRQIRLSGPGKA